MYNKGEQRAGLELSSGASLIQPNSAEKHNTNTSQCSRNSVTDAPTKRDMRPLYLKKKMPRNESGSPSVMETVWNVQ